MTGKWKDALLSSGLPLEAVVSEVLAQHGFEVEGEFPYIRKDEAGLSKEFSVDILATRPCNPEPRTNWGSLSLLAECKYAHPTTKWLFIPRPPVFGRWPGLFTMLEALSTRTIGYRTPLLDFERACQACLKGVVLHRDHVDDQGVHRGIQQLRYGISALVGREIDMQASGTSDEVAIVCSILVTTAPLYILRSGTTLETIRESDSLEDFADPVSYVVVENEAGPDVVRHARSIAKDLHRQHPHVRKRLAARQQLLQPERETLAKHFDTRFYRASERVLVVELSALGAMLADIYTRIDALTPTIGQPLELFLDGAMNSISVRLRSEPEKVNE